MIVEACSPETLPDDILIDTVVGVSPVNVDAVKLFFTAFGVFEDVNKFLNLPSAALFAYAPFLIFFNDVVFGENLDEAIVDDVGDDFVNSSSTTYRSLVAKQ